jgi:serine phosphatase RsbU (regulator of sigma subunit)
MYSINRIAKKLEEFGRNGKLSLEDIYKKFIDDLKSFTGGKVNYDDDVTLLLLKRDKNKAVLE